MTRLSALPSRGDHAPHAALEIRGVENVVLLVVLEIDRSLGAAVVLAWRRGERRPGIRLGLLRDLNAAADDVSQIEPTTSHRKTDLILRVRGAFDVGPALRVAARN